MLKHVTCRFFVSFCRFWNRCFYPFSKHPFGSQGFDQSGSDSVIMWFGTPQTRNNWCLVLCPGKTHRNRCHFLQQQHRSIWQSGSLAVCVTAARGGLWRCWCTEERAMAPAALRPQKMELAIWIWDGYGLILKPIVTWGSLILRTLHIIWYDGKNIKNSGMHSIMIQWVINKQYQGQCQPMVDAVFIIFSVIAGIVSKHPSHRLTQVFSYGSAVSASKSQWQQTSQLLQQMQKERLRRSAPWLVVTDQNLFPKWMSTY